MERKLNEWLGREVVLSLANGRDWVGTLRRVYLRGEDDRVALLLEDGCREEFVVNWARVMSIHCK